MRILAIETVDKTGSVAALEDGGLLAGRPLDTTRRSAQTLVPSLHQLLTDVGWKPADVQLVAVATGPGSFTGLRIGVTTAKAFAYATGCQVLGIHTMLAIGWRAPREIKQFSAAVGAQRGELFVAELVRHADGTLSGTESTRIVSADAWLSKLPAGSHITGPGLLKITEPFPAGVSALPRNLWQPTAIAVGQLAHLAYARGDRCELLALAPQYFRRTAAEEQWDLRQANS